MEFPVTVVKGKDKEKVLHAPDLKGWLDAGWEVETAKVEKKQPTSKKKEDAGLDL